VLVAAGVGSRLGGEHPKAFVPLAGRPLLAESLERLDLSDWVDAVVVAAPSGWEEPTILLAEELVASKVVAVVSGARVPTLNLVPHSTVVQSVPDLTESTSPTTLSTQSLSGPTRWSVNVPEVRTRGE